MAVAAGIAALTAASLVSPVATGAASAQTGSAGSLDSPQEPAFYQPPADFPAQAAANGDVVRSEPMPLVLSVPGGPSVIPATAQRIMYRSTNAAGAPIPVTGTMLTSSQPWKGTGPRPLASVAPGTMGQADQCAPSKGFQNGATIQTALPSVGFGYEALSASALLAAGFDVVVTDYEGLGTPGDHTYVDRASEGHAVLDAARAAGRLPGTRVTGETPVVYSGYSQGGGAAASAAELAASYAPELHSKGANAAAPPADLPATLDRIDGSLIAGAIGYAINGFVYSHPELRPILEDKLNDRGLAMLAAVRNQCIGDSVVQFGLHRTSEYTKDGRPASEVLREIPQVMAVLDEQRIGRIRPAMPVRVQGNVNDDAVPYGQVRQMARDWCAKGTAVDFHADPTPPVLPGAVLNHAVPMFTHQQEVTQYLLDRVQDVPAPTSCGSDPEMS